MKLAYSLIYIIFSFLIITTAVADIHVTICLKNRDGSVFTHSKDATAVFGTITDAGDIKTAQTSTIPDNGCISVLTLNMIKILWININDPPNQHCEEPEGYCDQIKSVTPYVPVKNGMMTLSPSIKTYNVFLY